MTTPTADDLKLWEKFDSSNRWLGWLAGLLGKHIHDGGRICEISSEYLEGHRFITIELEEAPGTKRYLAPGTYIQEGCEDEEEKPGVFRPGDLEEKLIETHSRLEAELDAYHEQLLLAHEYANQGPKHSGVVRLRQPDGSQYFARRKNLSGTDSAVPQVTPEQVFVPVLEEER